MSQQNQMKALIESFNKFLKEEEEQHTGHAVSGSENNDVEALASSFKDVQDGNIVLSYGFESEELKQLQKVVKLRLAQHKISSDLGATGPNNDGIDGKFGSKLKRAIEELQGQYGIFVDGTVGQQTFSALVQNQKPKDALGNYIQPTQLSNPTDDSNDDSANDDEYELTQAPNVLDPRVDEITTHADLLVFLQSHNLDYDTLRIDSRDNGTVIIKDYANDETAYEFRGLDTIAGIHGRGNALKYSGTGVPSDVSSLITPSMAELLSGLV